MIEIDLRTGQTIESEIPAEEIQAMEAERQRHFNSLSYAEKRSMEYPPLPEQLDMIFHGGIDAWKAKIQDIKNKYPKPILEE